MIAHFPVDAGNDWQYNPAMAYLIDGHNLIPKLPGISLRDVEDERRLIELLQSFSTLRRKRIEVYFDNAPPGGMSVRSYGMVTAFFVRAGKTADQAIQQRLRKLGREARNWTVVSSDRAVRSAARAAHAKVLTSEKFASLLLETLESRREKPSGEPEKPLDPQEIDEWLRIFQEGKDNGDFEE